MKYDEIEFTLENPTKPLEFVLTKHRDQFFHFLLNGPTKELTKRRMRRAIDLFFDIRYLEDRTIANFAQWEINTATRSGVQNLTVVRFFCEVLN